MVIAWAKQSAIKSALDQIRYEQQSRFLSEVE
jgi:hypothetical protein